MIIDNSSKAPPSCATGHGLHVKEGIRLIDMSMNRIRAVIDKACRDGKNYATIEKAGDDAVDAAVAQVIDGMGYKVAINPQEILISWS